jgi:hypothetical protein
MHYNDVNTTKVKTYYKSCTSHEWVSEGKGFNKARLDDEIT